jgi:hypothetical protein
MTHPTKALTHHTSNHGTDHLVSHSPSRSTSPPSCLTHPTNGPDGKRCTVSTKESPMKPKVEEATMSDGSVGDKGKSSKLVNEPPKEYIGRIGSEAW